MEKVTKVQALALAVEKIQALGQEENSLLIEKLEAMQAQEIKVAESKKGKKTVSKTAKEKAKNVAKVVEFFSIEENKEAFTLSEIAIAIGLEGATSQKMTPIIKDAMEEISLEKVLKDKKVAYKVA